MIENNLVRFVNGIAFTFFAFMSYHMLRSKRRTRIQNILGYTFIFWAILEFKDLFINYQDEKFSYFNNILFFIDSWAVPACSFYLLEQTSPGWINLKRIVVLLSPFLSMTILYLITAWPFLFYIYILFILLYSGSIVLVVVYAARRYNKYIHYNYSYSENIDISWLKKVTSILAGCLLVWVLTNIYITTWGDCIYYALSMLLWLVIVYYSKHQIIIPIPNNLKGNLLAKEPSNDKNDTEKEAEYNGYIYSFQEELQKAMDEQQLYLNPKLTINDVANAIGTNRTYLSSYFNNELQITFYDYINTLRIQKASKQLLLTYPYVMNIDEIAEISGFNSISTFRRAFQKNMGMTPLQYRKSNAPSNSF